ncbi:MAG: hypothetical protein ACRC8S_21340 [Fimbriiglobus sp.]
MGKRGFIVVSLLVLVIAIAGIGQNPVAQVHRNNFSSKDTTFFRGDTNIKIEEKDHKMSAEHHKSAGTSEYIKVDATAPMPGGEAPFAYYYYNTPPAPISEQLVLKTFVKSYQTGVQLKARVVFPKEKDPKNPDLPLTTLLVGDSYDKVRQWQALGFADPLETFKKHLPVLQTKLGRAINPTDAYIDRIILNVYSGPGVTELWIDDLEIGPIRGDASAILPPITPPAGKGTAPGVKTTKTKAVPVEFADGQILVDGDPFFMLAIRHSDTPLKTLREAKFNTVWFPNDTPATTIEESISHGFWIVPTLPLPGAEWDNRKPKKPDGKTIERDADASASYIRRFLSGDAVLMWDFGAGRTTEDIGRVAKAAEVVRTLDPRRPRAVDLWDGYSAYPKYVNAIGGHRWPLFSSLDLYSYRDWLQQRRALVGPGKMMWTWIQTHLPEWFVAQLCGQAEAKEFAYPVGPHPEQIRALTYLAIASGCRGLGFWSDKFLAKDTHNGRDRLLELAITNSEIDMFKSVLTTANDPATWTVTSDPNVPAAILRGSKEIVVIPIYIGNSMQYTPPLAAISSLKVFVPRVPEGSMAWRITPAGIEPLRDTNRRPNGLEIVIPEFDVACAIVISTDFNPTGKVVRWQDHTRFEMGETAARWAAELSVEQFDKITKTHAAILAAGGKEHEFTAEQFLRSRESMMLAKKFFEDKQWDLAYRESRRAMRPLRIVMRADWEQAIRRLDAPQASPYAVSFYSLPQHYQLAAEVLASRPVGNGFPHGGFELARQAPNEGAAVDSLPGWKARKLILDDCNGMASIVNTSSNGLEDPPPAPIIMATDRNAPQRAYIPPPYQAKPEHGNHALKLEITPKRRKEKDGKDAEPPQALERAVISVDSPAADFTPGSLVRVSFWAKVPDFIQGNADGLIVFDSSGGEPLGMRIRHQPYWRQFKLYRRVPPSGKVAMTFALTGIGSSYIDDVKIEQLQPVQ